MGPTADPDKKYFDVAKPSTNMPGGTPPFKYVKRQMINVDDGQKPQEESQSESDAEGATTTYDDTLIEPEEAFESTESSDSLSHPDLKAPDHIDIDKVDDNRDGDGQRPQDLEPTEDEDVPFVNPLPGTIDEEPKDVKNNENDPNKDDLDEVEQKNTNTNDSSQTDESAVTRDVKVQETLQNDVESKITSNTPAPTLDRFVASDALPDPSQPANDDTNQDMQDPKIFDTKEYHVPIGNTHHSHGSLKMALVFGVLCAAIVVGIVLYYVLKVSK
ncbi:MAG: hypothetical protein WCP03_02185 [Candidatus Saccharibacteria bacterium]